MILALKIIATVFLSLSIITSLIKNSSILFGSPHEKRNIIILTIYSWLWRALVIVALWIHE